jgi:hypothetical protein
MTHQYGNTGNDVAICRVRNIPEHGTSLLMSFNPEKTEIMFFLILVT